MKLQKEVDEFEKAQSRQANHDRINEQILKQVKEKHDMEVKNLQNQIDQLRSNLSARVWKQFHYLT